MTKIKKVITYRGAVEGLQEILYFEHLQELINEEPTFTKRVNFLFKNAAGGSPTNVVKKAQKNILNNDNPNIAVYDRDFKSDFLESIELANKHSIFPAYSNQNFNYFLILHQKYIYRQTTAEDKYENELKEVYHLDKNCDLKSEDTIKKILEQITLDQVKTAIRNAYKINNETKNLQKKLAENIYEQPYLKIVEFVEEILKNVQ